MNSTIIRAAFLLLLLGGLLVVPVGAQEKPEAKSPESFDWKAATAVFRKSQRGGDLTPSEETLLQEAKRRRRAGERPGGQRPVDPTRGDGTADQSPRNVHAVPAGQSPVRELKIRSADGKEFSVAMRAPKGEGPFPAILFFHGGMGQRPLKKLEREALVGRTHNEFLRRGFVSVTATYRKYDTEPRSRGPIEDAAATVRAIAALEEVDAESVVVFGGSGGGSIAIELAAEPEIPLAAVIAGEPATVIYTGMLESYAKRMEVMDEEVRGYTPEIKARTEEKIERIQRPILIHHGDQHALKHINYKFIIPAIKAAGKELRLETYPGAEHGFYWGSRLTPPQFEKLMKTSLEFLETKLQAAPARWLP